MRLIVVDEARQKRYYEKAYGPDVRVFCIHDIQAGAVRGMRFEAWAYYDDILESQEPAVVEAWLERTPSDRLPDDLRAQLDWMVYVSS